MPRPLFPNYIAATVLCILFLGFTVCLRADYASPTRYRVRWHNAGLGEHQDCQIDMPEGMGPRIEAPLVDDVAVFKTFPHFAEQAQAARSAPGYVLKDWNLNKAVSNDLVDFSLGQRNMESYDLNECADLCNSTSGCKAFNIYYQRSPSVAPSEGDDGACANPPSMTNIFCSLYSTAIKGHDMSWDGDKRGEFQMAVAGSNVFNKKTATTAQPHRSSWLPQVFLSPSAGKFQNIVPVAPVPESSDTSTKPSPAPKTQEIRRSF